VKVVKMSSWRQVGLNYIHYSRVCAKVVRRCLKPDLRVEAMKRDEGIVRPVFWKDGKAIQTKKPVTIQAEEKSWEVARNDKTVAARPFWDNTARVSHKLNINFLEHRVEKK